MQRIFVKESVFPFLKFPGDDILLGPEMNSTGEVMGVSPTSAWPSPRPRGGRLPHPHRGTVFITVNDNDKAGRAAPARARCTSSASASWPPAARPPT